MSVDLRRSDSKRLLHWRVGGLIRSLLPRRGTKSNSAFSNGQCGNRLRLVIVLRSRGVIDSPVARSRGPKVLWKVRIS